jgi:autophagy-related protein 2
MTSWYSSWFSGLPTFDFAVPSGIQRRFFSFILKRTLGRFLKPGQLDLHQIDSQLGSGTVQVKDLELDTQVSLVVSCLISEYLDRNSEAINQLLVGLPFRLHDGFILGVTALVPFPNPLTSRVGLHVQSLNLTLHVTPEKQISSPSSSPFHNSSNLADSVTSVAETFIHDELTPREEATLRHSLKPSTGPPPPVDETDNLPGGFNPFVHNLRDEEAHGGAHGDDNPAGVSVFATLIERLLARFEFSAMDTKVTIVHPGRSSFTISIPEISYRTDVKESPLPQSPPDGKSRPVSTGPEGSEYQGQVRTVSISGLKVTSQDLRLIVSSPTSTASTLSPASPSSPRHSSQAHRSPFVNLLSRNSSSSSLDEETELMMSHSIAMLPPRLPSPASSVSSSMYRSAISTAHAQSISDFACARSRPGSQGPENVGRVRPSPRISIPQQELVEDVIISFGSQPLVIQLQTPSPRTVPHEQAPQGGAASLKGASPNLVHEPSECEVLQLSITVGTLACAFRSCHLRMLLDMVDACLSNLPTPPPAPPKEEDLSKPPFSALRLEANIAVRAVVMIVLSEPAKGEVFSLNTCFDHPLVPPRLPCTYVRLFLDNLSASLQLSGPSPDISSSCTRQTGSSSQVAPSAAGKLVLSEVSVFAFHSVSSLDGQQIAAPILITDHYLPTLHTARRHRPSLTSERPGDVKLPVFNVVDWTEAKFQGGSAKLSTWRSRSRAISRNRDKMRSPSQIPRDLPTSPGPFLASPLPEVGDGWQLPPAIEIFCQSGPVNTSKTSTRSVDIKIAPLHLFLDLGMIFNENVLMPFVDDITSAAMFAPRNEGRQTNIEGVQSRRNQDLGELSEDDEDDEADLRSRHMSPRAWEREQERKRLEKRILEDLDLGMDYRTEGTTIPKALRGQPIARKPKVGNIVSPFFALNSFISDKNAKST